ncbi:hypothetical protein BHE90_001915 [Fusarium euwallaceae]|uniref:Uncharacterized protein n=1 Tax=Fusarium euwallaceae TaxID=1147111 RepID=A0A430M6F9_9HYPO|nr:hypothetical protein BHE90_001915 [Fusarium euwallaceae]
MRQLISNKSLLGQWLFEIGAVTLASAAVAAMVILLINFDGEPIFDGPMITLNAVISTLSTTSRVGLLAMLASTISQWNWLLFSSEPRRLVDFEYFSAASRGPLGSLKEFLKRGSEANIPFFDRPVVRVGAFVTILTIALDPFAQQLVQLEEKIKDDETRESQASIATAEYYSLGVVNTPEWSGRPNEGNFTVENGHLVPSSNDLLATVEPDSGMDIAIKLSYTDVDPGLKYQVAYNCSTADSSLKKRVVRRKELQIAELVKDQESPNGTNECTEYHLPNGLYLSNLDGDDDIYTPYPPLLMVMFGTGEQNETMTMTKVNTLIWAQSFISVDKDSVLEKGQFKWPEPKVAAHECALYYCIKRYDAAVKNGTLEENSTMLENHKRIKNSWRLYSKFSLERADFPEYANESLAWDPAVAAFERSDLMLGDISRNWSIASSAVYSISALMKRTFTKCMETRDNCTEDDNSDPPHGFVARGESIPAIADGWQYDPGNLFKKMASGMSVALRNGAGQKYSEEKYNVTGTTFFPVTVYRVAWPWIILHLLATIGSLAFLIATIWSTHKAKLPAWKSSELAVFSQVAAAKGVFSGGETYYELEEKAKAVPVVLLEKRNNEEGILLEDRGVSGDVSGEDVLLPTRSVSKTGSLFRRGRNRGEYESVRVDSP